jgi:hypothetical protein
VSRRRFVEARDQISERALPRPARTNESDDIAPARHERDVGEHRLRFVREGHAIKDDLALEALDEPRSPIGLDLGADVQDLE